MRRLRISDNFVRDSGDALAGRTDGVWPWESPEFLRSYELRGERITVDPNAQMRVDLDGIPWE